MNRAFLAAVLFLPALTTRAEGNSTEGKLCVLVRKLPPRER